MRLGFLQEETWSLLPTSSLVTVWGHGRELSICRLSRKHRLTSHQDNLFLTLTSQDVELGKGNACVLTHPTPSPSMVIFFMTETPRNWCYALSAQQIKDVCWGPADPYQVCEAFSLEGDIHKAPSLLLQLSLKTCKKVLVTVDIPCFSSEGCALISTPHQSVLASTGVPVVSTSRWPLLSVPSVFSMSCFCEGE